LDADSVGDSSGDGVVVGQTDRVGEKPFEVAEQAEIDEEKEMMANRESTIWEYRPRPIHPEAAVGSVAAVVVVAAVGAVVVVVAEVVVVVAETDVDWVWVSGDSP
jgi:hypothetical protein